MYTLYFGLKEKPFAIAPDPRYLYMSELHREAFAHLLYGISSDGCPSDQTDPSSLWRLP
jgi:general secretion pathway protein A